MSGIVPLKALINKIVTAKFSKGVFIKYGVGGVAKYRGGSEIFQTSLGGGSKIFRTIKGVGQKFFARVDLNCKTALERQFSPKKSKFSALRANSTILSKNITLLHFLHVIETHAYISNLFSHKNMYCLGPGYSRKGTLESDLKNLGGGSKIFQTTSGGGSKIFYTLKGVGQKFFRMSSRKICDPPHPVLNEHSLNCILPSFQRCIF